MKYIQKGNEPTSLEKYRKSVVPGTKEAYEGYSDKDALREVLLKEQGYICCYCMQRITNELVEVVTGKWQYKTRIEHWAPREIYNGEEGRPDLRLNYRNLMAACDGNQGRPKHLYCCDKSKDNHEITINPTQSICESQFYFSNSGEITSDDTDIKNDLDNILRLNIQIHVNNRKVALDKALQQLQPFSPKSQLAPRIQKVIDQLSRRDELEQHEPYFAYAIFHLRQRLESLSTNS